jgi:hypothetical protein
MADKLSIFNGALRLCKTRRLSTLTDQTEPRRLLDAVWANNGAINYCLEAGQWTFATRSGMIDYTPSIEPEFGYRYAFSQPTDMIRPIAICTDEYFRDPLLNYSDERRYWYCDLETIYVRWVSNGENYGADLSLWSERFGKFVEAYLANEIVANLTQDKDIIGYVGKVFDETKRDARSLDAMNKPTVFLPEGGWAASRRNRSNYRQIENNR